MIGDVFIEELQNLGHCTFGISCYSANRLTKGDMILKLLF